MNKCDLYWLAGMLEGEGSFLKGTPSQPGKSAISMVTTDEDIIQKVSKLMSSNYWAVGEKRRKNNPHWKIAYATRVSGAKAVELMKMLKPLMGKRRQQRIQESIDGFYQNVPLNRRLTEKDVLKIIALNNKGNLTQGAIAKKFGLDRVTVNKMCRGKMKKWKHLVE